MIKFFNANKRDSLKKLDSFLSLRKSRQRSQSSGVKKILLKVKKNGDKAVLSYEKKFSKVKTSDSRLIFSKKEIDTILKKIDKGVKKSIDIAFSRIKYFHSKQKHLSFKYKDKYNNQLSYRYLPLESVGVYVPGGTASYPSTV